MSQLNLSHRARKTRNNWLSQLTVLLLMKRQESLLYDGHFTGEFGIAKCPNPEGDLYKNLFVIGYCAGGRQQGYVVSKTLHQQNPPVLNWRCRLMQVNLNNGRKTVGDVVH